MGRRRGRVDPLDREVHGLHPRPGGRRAHPGRRHPEGAGGRVGGREVLPRRRGGPPERGDPEERRDAARDEGGRPLGLAAGVPGLRDPHHGRVDPPEDSPDAVVMRMAYETKARLLLGCVVALFFSPAGGRAQQDDDYQQKSTALLSWYPDEGDVKTKAAALAAAGKYVEALSIYDEALEKRPNTVIPIDKFKTFNLGLREYITGQIAAWPEEGKAAYRRRADPLAEHLFQGAKRTRDLETLERLVDQYPFSSVVDDALALIANIRLDAGENGAAAEALGRLLDREGAADRSVVIARLGLAWARAGKKAALEDLIRRVDRDPPEIGRAH